MYMKEHIAQGLFHGGHSANIIFVLRNIYNASMLKQQDSLRGKSPQMQNIYPPTKHGTHIGTGNTRKYKTVTLCRDILQNEVL